MNIENQFVPYELAIELKELGFNEGCIGYYTHGHPTLVDGVFLRDTHSPAYTITHEQASIFFFIKAPLWQQVVDWFRITHGIYSWLESVNYAAPNDTKIGYKVIIIGQRPISFYKTFEEARLIQLKRLIEIVKSEDVPKKS